MANTRELMSEAKFYEGYARYLEDKGRYETWDEAVDRVMGMHKGYYENKLSPELHELIDYVESHYRAKHVLGAQRALQFGGKELLKHQIRMYNCVSSHCDRIEFFSECMYMLLCGAGAGFSVQYQHINKLPKLHPRKKVTVTHTVDDSIEGWADAFDILLRTYLENDSKWYGKTVHFDLNKIRPKGAFISGGFKAPGPEPLRRALDSVERVLESVAESGRDKLKPIEAYDVIMHMADAVIAGGVRRSATICLFSPEDEEMTYAKSGNWFVNNPQRGRSNNSAVIKRDEVTKDDFVKIMKAVKSFGEPGFIFVEDKEFTFNPCVEIGKYPKTEDGRSGWQGCNLTELNGSWCDTPEKFYDACKAASILGTLQAGYTDFSYLPEETKEIFEREALIGVSVTGWMNNPDVLFSEEVMRKGAQEVKKWNRITAELIGINPAARTTCVKPSGNASVLLGTASGIHGEHSKRFIRNVQMNKETEVAKLIKDTNPRMVEESVWSANKTDYMISFPVETKEGSNYREDLVGVDQLEYVKKVQQVWIEEGTNVDLCVHPKLRHNVSNTITVDNWDEVTDYVYENRQWFAGISFLAGSGDKDYPQAPFTEVLTPEEIVEKYGTASMYASGLVVDGLHAFDKNLWAACSTALGKGEDLSEESHDNALKRDWVRRCKKYADNWFNGDAVLATYCLKDVYLLHKWDTINKNAKEIDWETDLGKKEFTEINTMGAVACNGNSCEITF